MRDTITQVGALVGLITGIFTAWDRLARARPIAYVHLRGTKGNVYRQVRVKNIDLVDIQVIAVRCWPTAFGAAKDRSVDGIVRAAIGQAPLQIIGPQEEHDFALIETGRVDIDALKTPYLVIMISWRRSSSPLLPQVPKLVVLSLNHLKRLEESPRPLL